MTTNARGSDPQNVPATDATVAQRTVQAQGDASLAGRAMAHRRWGLCEDRTEATAKARAKFQESFLIEAGGDPVRAESLRKAFYAKLALKSAQTRRRNAEARKAGA